MSLSKSLVGILVAMQWANEDVFNSVTDSYLVMLHSGEGGKGVGGEGRDMYVEKESGTVGSMVEERGGRCKAQKILA